MNKKCPYKIGDKVKFTPTERTKGLYQDIERFGIKIGEVKTIEDIREHVYLYFDDSTGGFPYNEFTLVK